MDIFALNWTTANDWKHRDKERWDRLHWSSWPRCHLQIGLLDVAWHWAESWNVDWTWHETKGLYLWQLVRYTHHLSQPVNNCNCISDYKRKTNLLESGWMCCSIHSDTPVASEVKIIAGWHWMEMSVNHQLNEPMNGESPLLACWPSSLIAPGR